MIVMVVEDRAARIRHDLATPVTVQVAADPEADLDGGRLAPDTRLPSEAELAERGKRSTISGLWSVSP